MALDPHITLIDNTRSGTTRNNGRVAAIERRVESLEKHAGGGTGGGITQAYTTSQDEGTPLTQRATINFIGPNIVAVDNAGSGRTDVTVNDTFTGATAGGSLSGTYPNPTIAASAVTNTEISATAAIAWSKMSGAGAAGGDLAGTYPNPTLSQQSASLPLKATVLVAAPVNITVASPGATVDGVTMAAGNRVLLPNQTTASENGLYVWNGAAVAMTRSTDANVAAEFVGGFIVSVQAGTSAGTVYVFVTTVAVTLGTTGLTFAKGGAAAAGGVVRRARAYRSAALSHTSTGVAQKITLDAADIDNDTMFDGVNGRLVVKTAGTWVITGSVGFGGNATGNWRMPIVMVNGTPRSETNVQPSVSTRTMETITPPLDLAVNDQIELWAYQDSGGNLAYSLTDSIGGNSFPLVWLSAVRIATGLSTSTVAIPFTDGDTSRRVTITDVGVTATSRPVVSISRTVTDATDPGWIYLANVVSVSTGSFDVLIAATELGEPTTSAPNETVALNYFY